MRVSVVQMNPGSAKASNIAAADRLIRQAVAADRADLVVLPEMWTCLGGDRATKLGAAETLPDPGSGQEGGTAYEFLRAIASDLRIHLHGGSIGERRAQDSSLIFNTTLVFDPEGREIARYRKIHLFDITTPDGQGYRESSTYGAGTAEVTCRIGEMTVGLAICYDLRFAELFLALRQAGAELILLPAAFTEQTGRDHWDILLRARAIETQCWFAAAATTGRHVEIGRDGPAERHTYGHSLICDPWGRVVAQAAEGAGWVTALVDTDPMRRIRQDMPVMEHRAAASLRARSDPLRA